MATDNSGFALETVSLAHYCVHRALRENGFIWNNNAFIYLDPPAHATALYDLINKIGEENDTRKRYKG